MILPWLWWVCVFPSGPLKAVSFSGWCVRQTPSPVLLVLLFPYQLPAFLWFLLRPFSWRPSVEVSLTLDTYSLLQGVLVAGWSDSFSHYSVAAVSAILSLRLMNSPIAAAGVSSLSFLLASFFSFLSFGSSDMLLRRDPRDLLPPVSFLRWMGEPGLSEDSLVSCPAVIITVLFPPVTFPSSPPLAHHSFLDWWVLSWYPGYGLFPEGRFLLLPTKSVSEYPIPSGLNRTPVLYDDMSLCL